MNTAFSKLADQVDALNRVAELRHGDLGLNENILSQILIDGIIAGKDHTQIAHDILNKLSPQQKSKISEKDVMDWAALAVKALPDTRVDVSEDFLVYDLSKKTLYWYDGTGQQIGEYPAVSGPHGNGALPEGRYHLEGRPRVKNAQNENGWRSFQDQSGNAWSQTIKPDFETNRTLLAVHPDGFGYPGTAPGTAGCIGLQMRNTIPFKTRLNTYLGNHPQMKLLVIK